MDILEEIIEHKKIENEQRMHFISPRKLYSLVEQRISLESAPPASMRQALLDSNTGIIAEFKRRSPSKGWINEAARASVVPLSYQRHGAAALSILTDIDYFAGYDEHVQEARQSGVTLPILYKNFVISEYQILQARFCGASAVLLIAAALDKESCRTLSRFAHDMGLEVLLELHGEEDLDYLDIEPDICGVNNRNLGSFVTDVKHSFDFADRLPVEMCKVSESGLDDPETVIRLREAGYCGFLMGEHFMRSQEPGQKLEQFITQLHH